MSSAHHHAQSRTAAEALLTSLAGVVSAHVVTDAAGRIVEIHILSAPDLHPKQVVRNVESALSAGLGLEIDRRIVSVAQIRTSTANGQPNGAAAAAGTSTAGTSAAGTSAAGGAAPAGSAASGAGPSGGAKAVPAERGAVEPEPATAGPRLEFVRYQSRRDAERCTCEVTLRARGEEITGTGDGADTAVGRAEAAARAVLDAVARSRPDLRLELEGAVISSSRGKSYVIVAAHSLLNRTTVPLAGAAPMARSPEEAAILAALQATNRWSS